VFTVKLVLNFKYITFGFKKPAVCLLHDHHLLVSQKSVRLFLLSLASRQVCYLERLSGLSTERDLLCRPIASIFLLPRAAVRIQDSKEWERAIYVKVSGREKQALRRCLRIL
jgi:hypothetical protein